MYHDLELTLEKNKFQKEIYKPSSFWKNASEKIIGEIKEFGIENFRNLNTPLGFFVPTYGTPTNSFTQEISDSILEQLEKMGTKKQQLAMEEFLSGYLHALSDYRVFKSSNNESKRPRLKDFSESSYGNPVEHFEFDDKKFSRSSLNYLLGLSFLKSHLGENDTIETVLEIGGGYGTLGEILYKAGGVKYIDIDIPPISFVAWNYLKSLSDEIEPFVHEKESVQIDKLKSLSVFNSWDIEKLEGTVDLFVNFISFQEMEPNIVENYLHHVKRLQTKWILLRNIREGKQVKKKEGDLGVEIPIKKGDYIDMMSDMYDLVDTNVIPYGYKTVDGFHSELFLFKRKNE